MEERGRIYAERRKKVREVCRHYDNGNRWKNDTQGDRFWFDLKNGLAICTNAKVSCTCCNYSSVQDFTWEVLQVGSTTLKKNLLILSDLPPSEKQNLETHAHEGVHGREMRKMFVLGEYEVGAPVRFRNE